MTKWIALFALLGMLIAPRVQAGTFYDTQAAFFAALPPGTSAAVETFDGLGSLLPMSLWFPEFGTADCVFCANFRGITSGADTWLSTDNPTGQIRFNFATPVTAVGGFFFSTGPGGQVLSGLDSYIWVEIVAGGQTVQHEYFSDSTPFLGYIPDSGGITQLTVAGLGSGFPGTYVTANDLTFTTSVPEPNSAVLLLGISMVLVVGLRSKRFNN